MRTTKIHVSIGTAAVLGLADLPMVTPPTTAYLMVGGRCAKNCAFCAQARESTASNLALSRVIWPEYPLDEVTTRLAEAERAGLLHRCCLQVTAGQGYYRCALTVVHQVRQAVSLPINVAILVREADQVAELFEAGVDRIGFGLDAACERVFGQVKGGDWAGTLATIERTARRYPGRMSVHLIVGLGETEREMMERILWARDLGVGIALFAFTPVRGTALAEQFPPSLSVYRRMQAARWLIVHQRSNLGDFDFDEQGALIEMHGHVSGGEAFRTSGCPNCNRPFYNERPGGPMYNYARPLTPAEVCQAMDDIAALCTDH